MRQARTTHPAAAWSGPALLLAGAVFALLVTVAALRSPSPAQDSSQARVPKAAPAAREDPAGHAAARRDAEIKRRFDEAATMLHARQYEHALASLHRLLALAPRMPEAHTNMGFALLGLQRHAAARDFFNGAIELRADQANAYFGLATSLEALGDLPAAIGAMRTYLHLARDERESHLRRARAALWEWESRARAPHAASSPGLGR